MSDTAPETDAKRPDALDPVHRIPGDPEKEPDSGVGLCLSGGGYRAMLFHTGVLWRLNDARLLPTFDRISSVSGGSITAAVLGLNWTKLAFDQTGFAADYGAQVVTPIRAMADQHVDVAAVVVGMLPFVSHADRVVKAYRDRLFGDASLQDLPGVPRFVINATNVESGALFRFSRPYSADYRVGKIDLLDIPLAEAVAASSAFPPFLSPFELDLREANWTTVDGNDLTDASYRGKVALSDGGVYDNLGLETVWKKCRTIFVSDGGGGFKTEPDPAGDWLRHTVRVLNIIDNQVRDLRKRQLVGGFTAHRRNGVYVGIRSQVDAYPIKDPMPVDPTVALRLADVATRLDAVPEDIQEQLINWGYVIADTGLRSWWPTKPRDVGQLPYPNRPLTAA